MGKEIITMLRAKIIKEESMTVTIEAQKENIRVAGS